MQKLFVGGKGLEGVTTPAPPPPPENFNRTQRCLQTCARDSYNLYRDQTLISEKSILLDI